MILVNADKINKSYTEKPLLSDISLSIHEGEKIGLIGVNGTGKSTLLRIIAGEEEPDSGRVVYTNDVTKAYLPQHPESDADLTVNEQAEKYIAQTAPDMPDFTWRSMLTKLGIRDFDAKMGELSGGQRKRVAMACVLASQADLLILDEPTNHMDMRSKDILKNAIMKYDGTVIVVSHDREFLDGMVSKVYEFRNGGVREYLGGIYYFLEKRKLESLQEVERKDAPAKEAAPKASSSGKLTYEQKKEQEKLLRKLRKAVETIEASLADLEKKIADYDRKFAEATQYNEADYKAYNELKAEYDHQMHEWEKASYELEITEGE